MTRLLMVPLLGAGAVALLAEATITLPRTGSLSPRRGAAPGCTVAVTPSAYAFVVSRANSAWQVAAVNPASPSPSIPCSASAVAFGYDFQPVPGVRYADVLAFNAVQPERTVDVNVWVFPPQSSLQQAYIDDALAFIDEANYVFTYLNPGGVRFLVTPSVRVGSVNAAGVPDVGDGCGSRLNGGLAASSRYKPTQLNVYLIEQARSDYAQVPQGITCSDLNRNVVFISFASAPWVTLAHELGHTLLGMPHSTPASVGSRNLMKATLAAKVGSGWVPVDSLTAGQGFIAHFKGDSWLVRGTPNNLCGTSSCPPLSLRWR